MISVEKLTKKHPGSERATLRDLCFSAAAGGITAILGGSGSGKSTLLRCLSGLDGFDSGAIVVDGVTVQGGGPPDALRGRVGFVFQSLELFPHLTVLQNCTLAPVVVKGWGRPTAETKARELLKALRVDVAEAAHPEALSGGQRQRVAIVRALMMEPRVLLYDEPTSALDPSLKAEVGRTLREVAERTGMTQVVVTHDPDWAKETCNDVFVLADGGLQRSTGTSAH
ncbi:MAG: ATP-binding cassette domain-containing protein [Deltaproteobacteria bacterium]|nr:ATP-binding cassette domain-containing protein [Deltaproteobacteria bacterium]